MFVANQEIIERALKIVCARQHLTGPDAEDFCSTFRLRLLETDYAILRKFEGRSSIQTYLVSVITHFFQDWRNARWGKWRPSAEARRLGNVAVELETLCVRDQVGFETACELLLARHGPALTRADLEALGARLPHRLTRAFVSDQEISSLASPVATPDAALLSNEAAEAARRATVAMRGALGELHAQDVLIVRMLVENDLPVATIARTLKLDQKPLYRRVHQVLATLRARLEDQGISAGDVADLLKHRGFEGVDDPDSTEIPDTVRLFSRDGRTPSAKRLE